jgi:hypothetical protein
MRVTFRQGIIRRQTVLTAPAFLRKTSLSGNTIDLVVTDQPTVVTFAHYSANYLIEESRTVTAAWGSGGSNSNNATLTPGQTQYLYWDIDLGSGQLTYGWTAVSPLISASEPLNPVHDTHWFDTVNTRMRVFRKPGPADGNWQDKIRLFAGVYDQSANLVPMPIGSQVIDPWKDSTTLQQGVIVTNLGRGSHYGNGR